MPDQPPTATIPFASLGLPDAVLRAVKSIGYESASPIQAATIPAIIVIPQAAT